MTEAIGVAEFCTAGEVEAAKPVHALCSELFGRNTDVQGDMMKLLFNYMCDDEVREKKCKKWKIPVLDFAGLGDINGPKSLRKLMRGVKCCAKPGCRKTCLARNCRKIGVNGTPTSFSAFCRTCYAKLRSYGVEEEWYLGQSWQKAQPAQAAPS